MIPDNRLWLLMSRRLSGEASPDEVRELQDLLEESPDKQQLLDILHSYFSALGSQSKPETADPDIEQRFRRVIQSAAETDPVVMTGQPPARKGRLRKIGARKMGARTWMYYAAAMAGMLVVSWSIFHQRQPEASRAGQKAGRGGEVTTRPGVRTKVVLPDGTQVWLNSNSVLKYAPGFNLQSREVELEGEAYFDVVRNTQQPFIVHTSAIDVRVLGTAFTVKSYPQDETVETTLLKGAIEVSGRDEANAPRVILKPDEKLVLDKHLHVSAPVAPSHHIKVISNQPERPDISVTPVPANVPDSEKVETAWLYNRLVFDGDSFKELAEKMERWYNVRIIFRDEDLYKYRFAGAFANESVKDALNALQLTAKFNYKISGYDIELFKK